MNDLAIISSVLLYCCLNNRSMSNDSLIFGSVYFFKSEDMFITKIAKSSAEKLGNDRVYVYLPP